MNDFFSLLISSKTPLLIQDVSIWHLSCSSTLRQVLRIQLKQRDIFLRCFLFVRRPYILNMCQDIPNFPAKDIWDNKLFQKKLENIDFCVDRISKNRPFSCFSLKIHISSSNLCIHCWNSNNFYLTPWNFPLISGGFFL